jgi:hypothetical protein
MHKLEKRINFSHFCPFYFIVCPLTENVGNAYPQRNTALYDKGVSPKSSHNTQKQLVDFILYCIVGWV